MFSTSLPSPLSVSFWEECFVDDFLFGFVLLTNGRVSLEPSTGILGHIFRNRYGNNDLKIRIYRIISFLSNSSGKKKRKKKTGKGERLKNDLFKERYLNQIQILFHLVLSHRQIHFQFLRKLSSNSHQKSSRIFRMN